MKKKLSTLTSKSSLAQPNRSGLALLHPLFVTGFTDAEGC